MLASLTASGLQSTAISEIASRWAKGVSEMRIHFGPGYRVYFTRRGEVFFLLLLGGDKSSQKRDIKRAIQMALALDKE